MVTTGKGSLKDSSRVDMVNAESTPEVAEADPDADAEADPEAAAEVVQDPAGP